MFPSHSVKCSCSSSHGSLMSPRPLLASSTGSIRFDLSYTAVVLRLLSITMLPHARTIAIQALLIYPLPFSIPMNSSITLPADSSHLALFTSPRISCSSHSICSALSQQSFSSPIRLSTMLTHPQHPFSTLSPRLV